MMKYGQLIALCAGCGAVAPTTSSEPPATTADSAATSGGSSSDTPEGDGSAVSPASPTAASAARAQPAPVLAFDSYPPGASPLDEADKQEVGAKCGKLVDAAKQLARKDRGKQPAAAYVEQLAASPPTIAGVDVPRCLDLILRDTRAYVARTLESAAANDLKRIVVGLSGAMMQGKLCASAAAVPADLATLKRGPVTPGPDAYATPGWMCVRFANQGAPQHFQYELRTDASDQSYEIVARGFPVKGKPAVELFLKGKAEDGQITPSSDVYRR